MNHRDYVQEQCDKLGIENPLREEDMHVAAASFQIDGVWKRIEATPMNRAGRFFFQLIYDRINFNSNEPIYETAPHVLRAAAQYFAEKWDDARKVKRPMIVALMDSTHFRVHWTEEYKKAPKPGWYKTFL